MMNQCSDSNRSDNIAAILENIPGSDAEPKALYLLCPSLKSDNSYCNACTRAVLEFLKVFAVITISPGNNESEIKIKAKTQTALYFLRSLAVYIRQGLTLISNWGDNVGVEGALLPNFVFRSGAQLVYLMEKRRTADHKDAVPIRKEVVSQVIIKAKIKACSKPVYLVQYDDQARQYQLIGGRKESIDKDTLAVMKREIDEELGQNHLVFNENYGLRELVSDLHVNKLSQSFGAYSEYHFTIYQAFIKSPQLILRPIDRWVTQKELFSGCDKKREKISGIDYIKKLDEGLPGGLENLPLSLAGTQKRPLGEILRERLWELVGIIVSILGIIIGILLS
jgi:hypothetical protein